MANKDLPASFHTPTVLNRTSLSFCDTSVKALTVWMGTLSLHKLGDTAEALLNALNELTELKCNETLRYDLIQVLHPFIEHVLIILVNHAPQLSAPYSDRKNQLIELCLRIRIRFIHLYMDMVYRSHQQLTDLKGAFFKFTLKRSLKNVRQLSSFYALRLFSRLLVLQQKNYDHCLVDQWLSTHMLYQLACKNGEQLVNINQLQGSNYSLQHIRHVYAQALLLNILYTYQVRPVETEALFHCTGEWVNLVQVTQEGTLSSRYSIDTNLDSPPIYKQKRPRDSNANLFLCTQDLLEHINNTIQYNSNSMSKIETQYLTPALQFHIQNILGTNHAERRHQRFEHSAQLEICFSVQAAHYHLTQAKHTPEQPTLLLPTLDRETIQVHITNVLDISAQGYRIHFPNERPKLLNTGEFILLKEQTDQHWKAGVIRWEKKYVMNSYAFGVEVLATQLQACYLQFTNQATKQSAQSIPSLILFQPSFGRSNFSLILPNLAEFNAEAPLILNLADQYFEIQLTKKLLTTESVLQFNFALSDPEQYRSLLNLLQH